MTTFGASMEEIKKLRHFQLNLMKRHFQVVEGRPPFLNMDFIGSVQITSHTDPTPQIKRIAIVNEDIQMDNGITTIAKPRILSITSNNNEVVVIFRRHIMGFGTWLKFTFLRTDIKNRFLEALGNVTSVESDASSEGIPSPPDSDATSGDSS